MGDPNRDFTSYATTRPDVPRRTTLSHYLTADMPDPSTLPAGTEVLWVEGTGGVDGGRLFSDGTDFYWPDSLGEYATIVPS